MNYLNDIWNYLLPMINWVVFVLVIASGYFIRATPILKKCSTTLKVLVFSLVVTVIYAISTKVNVGVYVASYFLAFGFHSAIIKMVERLFYSPAARARVGGELPVDDDE